MVMYALQDYIGEDKVNEAIRGFLKQYAFKGPPYPTSLDLEGYFRKVTPPEYQYLFDDLFQNITLYDDRARLGRLRSAAGWQVPGAPDG